MNNDKIDKALGNILDAIPYEITVKEVDGNYIYYNKNFLKKVKTPNYETLGSNVKNYWSESDYAEIKKLDYEVCSKNKGMYFERKLRSDDDDTNWYYIYKAPLNIYNNKLIISIFHEFTVAKDVGSLITYSLEKDLHDFLSYNEAEEDGELILHDEFSDRVMLLCKSLLPRILAKKINIYFYDEENNELDLYLATDKKDYKKNNNISLGKNNFVKFTESGVELNQNSLVAFFKDNNAMKIQEIKYGNNILGVMNVYYKDINDMSFSRDELVRFACYQLAPVFQNRIIKKKLKEEQRKKLKYKQALEVEKLETEFYAGVSHEFRTPLNIILSAVKLSKLVLNDDKLDQSKEKIQRNLDYIEQNSNRLLRLMNNIIDLNKINAGFNNINYTSCNIVELIEDISMSVKDYIRFSGRNIIFDTEEEEIITSCDVNKIERIMMNLLSNAIKYSNKNTDILVNIKLNDIKDKVIVSVFDEGVSIDKNDDDKVFQKYVQLHNLLDRPCEGSGIGLYLVKSFVEQHGGEVWVNYEAKNGTEIDFTIPIKDVSQNRSSNDIQNEKIRDNSCSVEFSDIYSIQ